MTADMGGYIRARVVVDANGCWIWQGPQTNNGYGMASSGKGGRTTTAHRRAYTAAHGEIAPGMQIDHLCRVRLCCNPDHLESVTPTENVQRALAATGRDTHCKRGHEFTPENTMVYKTGSRHCRQCTHERVRAFKARKRAERKAAAA